MEEDQIRKKELDDEDEGPVLFTFSIADSYQASRSEDACLVTDESNHWI